MLELVRQHEFEELYFDQGLARWHEFEESEEMRIVSPAGAGAPA
jgi:hypothetical protein